MESEREFNGEIDLDKDVGVFLTSYVATSHRSSYVLSESRTTFS
jgi:hypothetical protein